MQKPYEYDWDSLDWSQTNKVISKITGCSTSTVRRKRITLGKPSSSIARQQTDCDSIDWESLDWSKTDKELCEIVGCSPSTMGRRRAALEKPTSPAVRRVEADWRSVDWTKIDRIIAKELGCSVHVVHLRRHEYGHKSNHSPAMRCDWDSVDWSKPLHVIAEELGCSEHAVRRKGRELGHERTYNKVDVDISSIDWDTPTADLAEKYEVSRATISVWRSRYSSKLTPKQISEILSKRAADKGENHPTAGHFILVSPQGEVIEVHNLSLWVRENLYRFDCSTTSIKPSKYVRASLSAVISERRAHFQNWTAYEAGKEPIIDTNE